MTLHKLKVAALQHEQREDWGAAIELYRQAIREAESSPDGSDPSLYNRVGDLSHKAGDDAAACESWDLGVARYGELGFLNSAIALCGKILRADPARFHTYIELARLHARKRVLFDVRENLQLFLDKMGRVGDAEVARKAVIRFGEEFPGWRDLDTLLDELLGHGHAREAPRKGAAAPGPSGAGLVFLDTAVRQTESAVQPGQRPAVKQADGASVVERVEPHATAADEPTRGADSVPHRETPSSEPVSRPPSIAASDSRAERGSSPPVGGVEGLVGVGQAARDLPPVERLVGLDEAPKVDRGVVAPLDGLEQTAHVGQGPPAADAPPAPRPIGDPAGAPVAHAPVAEGVRNELIFLQTEPPSVAPAGSDDDPLGRRVAAEALLEHGDRAGAIAALERSLASYQEKGEWLHAYHAATELIQAEPAAIGRYQARVEIAARMREPARLCEAYADLGDALVRAGSEEKAVAVYRRVLDLDDNHQRARAALRAMAPEAAPAASSEFIDLGAMLIDDHPRSTRMRTETPDVAADEDATFRDALAEFRRALDQNLPVEDHQAHYDLGIAFKEMGLLDEAISEFQKALRAPEVRLRTSEALGEVFFDQGRPAVAEAVLRGVENSADGDAAKIGVLYWLGRALDAQGRHADAVTYYQRIVAVDVGFRDVGVRLNPPTGGDTG